MKKVYTIYDDLNNHFYNVIQDKPTKKFIELNKMTGEFNFIDNIGNSTHSIYIPIVKLIKSTLRFPIDDLDED